MMKKVFVEVYEASDCEGRYFKWYRTDKTYEEAKATLSYYGYAPYKVREVEKIFNEETFEVTYGEVLREDKATDKHRGD